MNPKLNLESNFLEEEIHVSMDLIKDIQKLAAEQKTKAIENSYNEGIEGENPSPKYTSSELKQMREISEDFEFFEE